jgi:hypothetical protein
VFTAIGNKQDVLAAVRDWALAGDDAPVPIAERERAALNDAKWPS